MQEVSTCLNKYIHTHIFEKSTFIGINVILVSHHYQKFYHIFSKFRGMNVCSIPPYQKVGEDISPIPPSIYAHVHQ